MRKVLGNDFTMCVRVIVLGTELLRLVYTALKPPMMHRLFITSSHQVWAIQQRPSDKSLQTDADLGLPNYNKIAYRWFTLFLHSEYDSCASNFKVRWAFRQYIINKNIPFEVSL
jgi:hypothetical protein